MDPNSTLPPIKPELAPLLRCSAFLSFARGSNCEPDVRFLLLATDYAIFYSAVKLRPQSDDPHETQKHAALVTQLNSYATAMLNSFFMSTDEQQRLSLLREPPPISSTFLNLAVTRHETRHLGLHAEAEKLVRNPLPKPAPPALFQPCFVLVQSHLNAWLVPRFDVALVKNTKGRIIPFVLCVFFLAVSIGIAVSQKKLQRIWSLPFFFLGGMMYAHGISRFSVFRHLIGKRETEPTVESPKSSFSSSNACANCPMLQQRKSELKTAKVVHHVSYSLLFALSLTILVTFLTP